MRAWDPTSFSMFLKVLHVFWFVELAVLHFVGFRYYFSVFDFLVKDQAVGASPPGFPQLPPEGPLRSFAWELSLANSRL